MDWNADTKEGKKEKSEMEEELEEELASERDAWEAALEAAAPVDLDELDDRDDEILAEQETLYCRELLTLSN